MAERILSRISTKSRQSIYGSSVRLAAARATEAREEADKLACEAWTKRMLGFRGPAQPSPTLGDALSAGYRYLEVRYLGCDTHQTVALDIVRLPKATPVRSDKEARQVNGPSTSDNRVSSGHGSPLIAVQWLHR